MHVFFSSIPLWARICTIGLSPQGDQHNASNTEKAKKEGENEVWREGRKNNIIEFITCYP